MRIHTDTLTLQDLYVAAEKARVWPTFTEHNSRKRDHAFEVKLTGLSRRRPNGGNSGAGDDYAATWDQWGVFLGYLYSIDDAMICNGAYVSDADFDYKTAYRFALDYSEPIPFPLDHDHRWKFSGTPREFECVKPGCTAVKRGA